MKTTLITGANRGLGLEFVKQLSGVSKPRHFLLGFSQNATYGYNNVANRLEILQTIPRNLIVSRPGEKFVYLASNTVRSSWQITYSGIGHLFCNMESGDMEKKMESLSKLRGQSNG